MGEIVGEGYNLSVPDDKFVPKIMKRRFPNP